jgi:transcriptional regulator with XRE-family HTH domain
MPVGVAYRPEFAELINKMSEGLNNEQVAIRIGTSAEYVRKMRKLGQVPSVDILERIANGMKDKGADLHLLKVVAGYEKPTHAVEAVELGLRTVNNIPEEGKQQIIDFAKRMEKKYQKPEE